MTRQKLHVVAACISENGRILLDRRKRGGHLSEHWEFPGGKRESGESDQEALVRELEEELGVTTEVGQQLASVEHAYEEFDIYLVLYEARIVRGSPQALEVAAIEWFKPQELKTLKMPPADGPLVDAVLKRII